ncbi:FAD-dependent oxidoreductase [Streptomyces sp. WAC05374]|uniref:flavin monoamine oxidase family protein n=1 Tax=Streptomyces sp. WAC05374 TaxID=2487420 RepID=UPI000F866686|nr:NAD(P)/FAD-dependent oxidoreductase [Streptomyces sp. WAC05374]RST14226.1 FAD-dependent oxidoreductase [Streptomyces sp. WAC05374]TDF40749.1 FAD-dependent oxidoreductase [Streptomyces sp. WAC05374]TDF49342.1 FAD-dependent oxidoreductase [Streptomyces sp. WAC05374]TDF49965.1 FAD-dependent oxidoreductase [Streptomyces sp. WAC05374]
MSRTPLMRALRDIAAHRAAAERLGVPVDAVRGSTRRELLRRAAALGLAAGVGTAVAATPGRAHAATAPRIAVVGAGIAGLTAALTLKDAGLNCTLYEAHPTRVGGRMWTQRDHWAHGQISEIGGELIDTSHKKMQELCRRFGLPLEDFLGGGPAGAEEVLWFDGAYYPRHQADEDFKAVYQQLHRDLQEAGEVKWNQSTPHGTALDNMSIHEWIESRVPGGHASPLGQFIDVAYNVEYGADTTEQSSLALVLLMGYQTNPGHFNVWGLSNERYHITGGNDRLPRAIAAALPTGTLRMGWSLTAVRANADGTQTLTFTEGATTRTVTADHTVLCVPLPILKGLDLSRAGFDPRMRDLLRDARMGHCTKLNMQCATRPWRGTGPWPGVCAGDCFTDTDVQQTWDTTKIQPGTGGILIQYNGGTLAQSLTPAGPFSTESDPYVRDLAARRLRGIDAFFPGTSTAWTGRAQLSAWHRNPYTLGAYSMWPVGYLHRYAGYEGTAQGNVHIGGEHCSYDFQGFMEGGATEGERAAREVIAAC